MVGRHEALRQLAAGIKYYPGVEDWFDRVNAYVDDVSDGQVETRHYIVSAGLSEILEGISIKHHFNRIYASQYYFDHHEAARFPTMWSATARRISAVCATRC